MNYAVAEIACMLGVGVNGTGDARVCSVTNDSRRASAGTLFVALPGDHVDGHDYVQDAFLRGATAALVRQDRHLDPTEHGSLIAVEDPLTALYDLAYGHSAAHRTAVRIGITGSSGKTTTKEIIGSILKLNSHSIVSEASFNAEIGLPMSVLRMQGDERFAVFEIGINSVGEMERYAALAMPDHALVTNIGSAHVGRIGSQGHIAREKGALLRAVDSDGFIYISDKELLSDFLLEGTIANVVKFGTDSTIGYEGSESLGLDGWFIHWEGLQIRFPLPGRHNLENALAAMTVSKELGCSTKSVVAGIEAIRSAPGRLRIHHGNWTVIDDGYNANPESVRAALEVMGEAQAGRRIVVLGPMLELGNHSEEAHCSIISDLTNAGIDLLFCFGEATQPICQLFVAATDGTGSQQRAYWKDSVEEIGEPLGLALRDGDVVLLKASRAFRIESLLSVLGVRDKEV